jgi:hypothetical protein
MRRYLRVAALSVVLSGCSDRATGPTTAITALQPVEAKAGTRTPEVHIIYLVPAGSRVRRDYVQNLRDAAVNLQAWFSTALGTGETFTLANPTVAVYRTEHDASSYATTPAGTDPSLWFWYNATTDGFALTGGSFNDPDDVWIFYIDAAPACGQATGGAASVALLPANDLRGLAGEPTISPCTGAVEAYQGPCRWVGGLGHELGHALGLPHPAACEAGLPNCPTYALMWFGYTTYPDAYLTMDDRALLEESAFISDVKLTGKVPSCTSIGGSELSSASTAALAMTQRPALVRTESRPECASRVLAATTQAALHASTATLRSAVAR